MINLVKNAVKIFKENLIFSFRSKYLKYKLKVSGNSKKLSQLQLHTEIGNRVIVIVFSITITITITLIVCNCNSVRFFECVIVIVLAFCYYRLLLPLTFSLFFKSLDLKYIYNNLQQCRKHTF